ncbi:MAG TPA: PQQ-dependent sugar dehydrogenase [Steroidobacteraceae bacterium]|nr:PQQ-dependent sugar dehydrogenase [Steroidobacteraceae bacterium]
MHALRALPILVVASVAAINLLPRARAQQSSVGIAPVSLTAPSYVFDTAEEHKVRVVVVMRGLRHPFGFALLPDGDALVSERGSALRLVHNVGGAAGTPAFLDPKPITGVPPVEPAYRGGGLQDVALHPSFAQNHLVYFTFNKPGALPAPDAKPPAARLGIVSLMRGTLADGALRHVEELFSAKESGYSGGSRLAFDGHGMLYLTTGAPFSDQAQRLDSVYGKVLRLREDGTVPADNPFVGRADARPEIFSLGHRDQLGLTVDPWNDAVLDTEEGPNGGDKVNVILPGRNYGWPKASFGRNYDGSVLTESPLLEGIEHPLIVWLPSIAPGNLTFYTGERLAAWKGNLFVTSARRGEIPRTGGLERVVLNSSLGELRRETLFTELHQRMRDVRQGADGLLYVATDEEDGALLRIEPAP